MQKREVTCKLLRVGGRCCHVMFQHLGLSFGFFIYIFNQTLETYSNICLFYLVICHLSLVLCQLSQTIYKIRKAHAVVANGLICRILDTQISNNFLQVMFNC